MLYMKQLFIWLCFLIFLLFARKIHATPQKPYVLTFGIFSYVSDCNPNDSSNFSAMRGYEPTLVLDAMRLANLTYRVDIIFYCAVSESEYTVFGPNRNTSTIGSFGGLFISADQAKQGYTLSLLTMDSGLSIG